MKYLSPNLSKKILDKVKTNLNLLNLDLSISKTVIKIYSPIFYKRAPVLQFEYTVLELEG